MSEVKEVKDGIEEVGRWGKRRRDLSWGARERKDGREEAWGGGLSGPRRSRRVREGPGKKW